MQINPLFQEDIGTLSILLIAEHRMVANTSIDMTNLYSSPIDETTVQQARKQLMGLGSLHHLKVPLSLHVHIAIAFSLSGIEKMIAQGRFVI